MRTLCRQFGNSHHGQNYFKNLFINFSSYMRIVYKHILFLLYMPTSYNHNNHTMGLKILFDNYKKMPTRMKAADQKKKKKNAACQMGQLTFLLFAAFVFNLVVVIFAFFSCLLFINNEKCFCLSFAVVIVVACKNICALLFLTPGHK